VKTTLIFSRGATFLLLENVIIIFILCLLTEQNRTEFISINLYKVHRLKYKVYMHNITRDSRKKEDSF